MLEIIGLGLDPQKHCSLHLIEIIKAADANITFDPIGNIANFLSSIDAREDNIERLYPDHLYRRLYYKNIAEYVLRRAERLRHVTYLTYGNPCILDEPVENIVRSCRDTGIPFRIHANVSFLDEILAENSVFVGQRGIRMCTARAIVQDNAQSPNDELLVVSQPIELGHLDENNILKVCPKELVSLARKLVDMRGDSPLIIAQAATTHFMARSLKATVITLPFFASVINALTSIIILPGRIEATGRH